MTKADLKAIKERVDTEARRRRGLGGYSTDAIGILALFEVASDILDHLINEPSAKKKKSSRKK